MVATYDQYFHFEETKFAWFVGAAAGHCKSTAQDYCPDPTNFNFTARIHAKTTGQ